jgi:hypothetical protein
MKERETTWRIEVKMGLERILGRLAGGVWSGFTWLRIGPVVGSCGCGDEPLHSGTTEIVIMPPSSGLPWNLLRSPHGITDQKANIGNLLTYFCCASHA